MPQPVSTTETWANLGMLAEPGHQGYRRQERAALMGFVPYEMREFLGEDSIVIHQGEALSLNISDGGDVVDDGPGSSCTTSVRTAHACLHGREGAHAGRGLLDPSGSDRGRRHEVPGGGQVSGRLVLRSHGASRRAPWVRASTCGLVALRT